MATLTRILLCCLSFALFGCGLFEEPSKKSSSARLIVTPVSAYTTERGRYLGERYQQNLDRLVEQIVQNPVTGRLQFANNIVAVGGIGFFTHSATRAPDERYLEVILGLPDVLDEKTDFSSKVDWLFSQYGFELLSILTTEQEIYDDRNVSGYGLNFSWRTTSEVPSGPRVALESGVIYIRKENTQNFLARQISHEALLGGSVIFAIQGEGPARLARYLPQPPKATAQLETGRKSAQIPSVELKAPPPPLAPHEALSEKPTEAQVSLKERTPVIPPQRGPKREGMQGYIVQLTLSERAEAERLSERLNGQGYTTSATAVGEDQAVRLRVGTFPTHAGAKKFLDQLRQQGIAGGLVLQVPK